MSLDQIIHQVSKLLTVHARLLYTLHLACITYTLLLL